MKMGEEAVFISFACQRCLQPLRLDDTFNYLGEHIIAELSIPVHSNPDVDLESQAASLDQFIQPCRLSDSGNGANGFMLISDTGELETISNQMKVRATLLDVISENSNIDHPLCDECADALLEMLEQQVQLTQNDYHDYCEYLNRLENDSEDLQIHVLEKELEDLRSEEQRLLQELELMQQEETATLEEIAKQKAQSQRLAQEEDRYWREYTRHRKDVMLAEDEYRSIECQLSYAQSHLDKLKNTNVFNATFHIWHSGHFGTINNFRLGRLPLVPVEWSEINAAWGQTVLLLAALARKTNLKFERYKLVPYGNHSHIEVLADQKEIPLFGSGGFRFLWDTKFDAGMAAFLDCAQQFREKIREKDKHLALPYAMNKGKLEDTNGTLYSIKIQFNSEEQWTRALKYMLTNLKWSLAWVSTQFVDDEDSNEQE